MDKNKVYTSEDAMLADFMTWAKNENPELRSLIFHIENEGNAGGADGARQGGVSLAKGKLAGVPDVECVYMQTRWAEFKLPKHRNTPTRGMSPAQQNLFPKWKAHGIIIYFIDNFQDWEAFIALCLGKLKSDSLIPKY